MFELLAGLITLTILEIVLGIDNMLVVAIMSSRLPKDQQRKARITGLSVAMLTRAMLLGSVNWLVGLTATIFTVSGHSFSWRDLILLAGGLFLLWKSVHEIHQAVEVEISGEEHDHESENTPAKPRMSFAGCIFQMVILDIVFSLDSVITAVGLSRNLPVMIGAVIGGALAMMAFTGAVAGFIQRNPSVKVLALAFLTLIGATLTMEAFHVEVPKGYLYCAIGFSFAVELLHLRRQRNIKVRKVADGDSTSPTT